MSVIIRRSAPTTIIRRRPKSTNWPGIQPGYPLRDNESAYHMIRIRGEKHVFLWIPGAALEQMWSCGLYRCSPAVMAAHEYLGIASVVYTADDRQVEYGRSRRW